MKSGQLDSMVALLELLLQQAQFELSGHALTAQFSSLSVLILIFQDGSTLPHLASLSSPLTIILQIQDFPPADRYLPPSLITVRKADHVLS